MANPTNIPVNIELWGKTVKPNEQAYEKLPKGLVTMGEITLTGHYEPNVIQSSVRVIFPDGQIVEIPSSQIEITYGDELRERENGK